MQVYSPAPKSWEFYFGSLGTFPVSGEGSAMEQKTSTVKAAKAIGTTTQTVCEWIVDTIRYYIDFTRVD